MPNWISFVVSVVSVVLVLLVGVRVVWMRRGIGRGKGGVIIAFFAMMVVWPFMISKVFGNESLLQMVQFSGLMALSVLVPNPRMAEKRLEVIDMLFTILGERGDENGHEFIERRMARNFGLRVTLPVLIAVLAQFLIMGFDGTL